MCQFASSGREVRLACLARTPDGDTSRLPFQGDEEAAGDPSGRRGACGRGAPCHPVPGRLPRREFPLLGRQAKTMAANPWAHDIWPAHPPAAGVRRGSRTLRGGPPGRVRDAPAAPGPDGGHRVRHRHRSATLHDHAVPPPPLGTQSLRASTGDSPFGSKPCAILPWLKHHRSGILPLSLLTQAAVADPAVQVDLASGNAGATDGNGDGDEGNRRLPQAHVNHRPTSAGRRAAGWLLLLKSGRSAVRPRPAHRL
jgi:hypothetical protein